VPDITYQFRFKTTIKNPNTFLYNTGPINSLGDPSYNYTQTYTLTKVENGVSTILGVDIPVAPSNIGPKSTPNFAALQSQSITTVASSTKVFVGQSDDPFFAELGGLFDLLTIRTLPGNMGGGVDGLKGYNVHSLVLQVPIAELTMNHNQPASSTDPASVIGVWTTSSRHATTVLGSTPLADTATGDWVQVSRLGAPLVNEVVVPLGAKDIWNRSNPVNDAQFANGVANPELGGLLKALYNINVPPQGNFGSSTERDDLEAIFLTGIPGLTHQVAGVPAEELRLNVAIPPTATPNKLGVLGGDHQGYPNGRRLGDDVVDISLRAVAGAAYPLFHPGFTPDATGIQLGDGVDGNDSAFRSTFPYLALPHQGYLSIPHGIDYVAGTSTGGTPGTGTTTATTDTGTGAGTATSTGTTATTSSSTGTGATSATSTGTTATSTSTVVSPPTITVRTGTNVDFNGRDFGHEETVYVTLDGILLRNAHADGGGNFTTGSISVPSALGTYTYSFTGQNSGIIRMVTVMVTQ
jgi:plastocyanin